MMARLPWILLGLSVLFNFFFAGGFLQAKDELTTVSGEQGALDELADRLDLTAEQRQAYLRLKRDAREHAAEVRSAVEDIRERFWDELAGDTPNAEELAELHRLEAEQRFRGRLMMARRLREFADTFTPGQRRQFVRMVRRRLDEHRRPRPRPPHDVRGGRPGGPPNTGPATAPGAEMRRRMILHRFDTDGDGVLSAEERARAFEAIRARRRNRHDAHADEN
jgi:uncharacterized membrane protein